MLAPRRLFSSSSLLTALLVSSSCGDAPLEHETFTIEQGIQNGNVDNDRKFVVGLRMIVNNRQYICSGTLIAPNLVLTAQHCVAHIASQYVICGQTSFGSKYDPSQVNVTTDTQQNNATFYSVKSIHVPPGGNDVCDHDIALVILNQNIPSSVTSPIEPRLDVPVAPGEEYTAVGYGHTGNGGGSGTRRSITGRRVSCGGTSTCPNHIAKGREFMTEDSNTCQGDSGGSVLDAQNRVLGALSRGGPQPGNPYNQCYTSIHTGVAGWASWIRQIAAQASAEGGYAAPGWIGGTSTPDPGPDPDPTPDNNTPGGQTDTDRDGVPDTQDNCPNDSNTDQLDADRDAQGDECDADIDGDGHANEQDNCPSTYNPTQSDIDADTYGDNCDADTDGDTIPNVMDNCPYNSNADQLDTDSDNTGDACDIDADGDGMLDDTSRCADDQCQAPADTGTSPLPVPPTMDEPPPPDTSSPLAPTNSGPIEATGSSCAQASSPQAPAAPLGLLGLALLGLVRRRRA